MAASSSWIGASLTCSGTISSALYCMFKMEHGYCTSGMKEAIADMYESYKARGYNHIAESRIKELLALPEYPHN